MPKLARYVQPIHFEDYSGAQFERLVFAFCWRSEKWQSLEWYGQAGSDLGRDIWGVRENSESVCIQCVNRKSLRFDKAEKDIAKVLESDHGVPHTFRIVAASNISASLRDKIKKHVLSLGVKASEIWSGAEFEEFLRNGAESLLRRFVGGEEFPDTSTDLKSISLREPEYFDVSGPIEQTWNAGNSTAYWLKVTNTSVAKTIRSVRAEVIRIEPPQAHLNWPVPLVVKHSQGMSVRDSTYLHAGQTGGFDLVSAQRGGPISIEHTVPINKILHEGRVFRLTVKITGEDVPPVAKQFDVWQDARGCLRCKSVSS